MLNEHNLFATIEKKRVCFKLGENMLIIEGDDWEQVMRDVYVQCRSVDWLHKPQYCFVAPVVTDILVAKNGDRDPEDFSWTQDALGAETTQVAFDEEGTMYLVRPSPDNQ